MNILISGITATGKSSIAAELKARGLSAYDADYDELISYWADKVTGERREESVEPLNWMWDGNALRRTLNMPHGENIFICGNSYNQSKFYPWFDKIFALIADNDTLTIRIQNRTANHFGKDPNQLAWVLTENTNLTTSLLEAGAIAIDATQPLPEVVQEILKESL